MKNKNIRENHGNQTWKSLPQLGVFGCNSLLRLVWILSSGSFSKSSSSNRPSSLPSAKIRSTALQVFFLLSSLKTRSFSLPVLSLVLSLKTLFSSLLIFLCFLPPQPNSLLPLKYLSTLTSKKHLHPKKHPFCQPLLSLIRSSSEKKISNQITTPLHSLTACSFYNILLIGVLFWLLPPAPSQWQDAGDQSSSSTWLPEIWTFDKTGCMKCTPTWGLHIHIKKII